MLIFEIFKSVDELSQYLFSSITNSPDTIIYASPQEIIERLGNKGQEWYCLTYRGERKEMCDYLAAIKIDSWKDYYLHINMPQGYTTGDMTNVAADICKVNNSPQIEPVVRCTADSTLAHNEIEVTVIVPKFDLNWHFGKMWNK